ncbi:MAG: sialidase family protein [Pseudomonadales bacterium]|nr:sialidase family protein [Kiritimatiellia bacterium]MDP6972215.1 sialidase family protein [Pseudomonadales bacterium]
MVNYTRTPALFVAAILWLVACTPAQKANELLSLELVSKVDHLAISAAREPMLAVHPNGTFFVAAYGRQDTGTDWTVPPLLWSSDNGGKNWQLVDVGTSEDGAQGNSDTDLTIAADGTIYYVSMGFNRGTRAGTHVTMGVSKDAGNSWWWQMLSQTEFDDRPWVVVAPDNAVHTIWNDGAGIPYFISQDGGISWQEQPRITNAGGSSHLAVGPRGELAVRVSNLSASGNSFDEGLDAIAVSTDGGQTWASRDIPGNIEWDPTFSDPTKIMRWVEPLAFGPDSTLYHLWSEGVNLILGQSEDLGETWRRQIIFTSDGVSFFPLLTANDTGQLLASWYVMQDGALTGRVAHVDTTRQNPAAVVSEPLQLQAWNGDSPDTAGEYLTAEFLPNGDIGAVTTIQDAANNRNGLTFWRLRLQ